MREILLAREKFGEASLLSWLHNAAEIPVYQRAPNVRYQHVSIFYDVPPQPLSLWTFPQASRAVSGNKQPLGTNAAL